MFSIDHESPAPLVAQIVGGFRQLIESRVLKTGARLPSIRQFAQAHGVSVFTVVEAYDRLVASGLVHSKPNAGFFVRPRAAAIEPARADAQLQFDAKWYLRQIFESRALDIKPGCGWLPQDWLFAEGVQRALRQLAQEGSGLGGYGSPLGHEGLRGMLVDALAERQIVAGLEHLLLTQGSSQALDLLARYWVQPGDAVLVDTPGYPNVHYILRLLGATLLPVPRTPEGYDLPALEALLESHRPKVFFTQPRLHSPSNSTAPLHQLLRILQLAHLRDFAIVENDIYADLDPDFHPSLASLDRLQRVAYLGSFSKTIAPHLRVGYVAAAPKVLEELATRKMISGLTSSELGERVVFHVLAEGRWRKHLGKLRARLAQAQQDVAQQLVALGFELHTQASAGMYLWARHPDMPDAALLSEQAARQGIMLGPGHLFYPEPRQSGWLRFNVAFSADARLWEYISAKIEQTASGAE